MGVGVEVVVVVGGGGQRATPPWRECPRGEPAPVAVTSPHVGVFQSRIKLHWRLDVRLSALTPPPPSHTTSACLHEPNSVQATHGGRVAAVAAALSGTRVAPHVVATPLTCRQRTQHARVRGCMRARRPDAPPVRRDRTAGTHLSSCRALIPLPSRWRVNVEVQPLCHGDPQIARLEVPALRPLPACAIDTWTTRFPNSSAAFMHLRVPKHAQPAC
jgi:hypothetical protein